MLSNELVTFFSVQHSFSSFQPPQIDFSDMDIDKESKQMKRKTDEKEILDEEPYDKYAKLTHEKLIQKEEEIINYSTRMLEDYTEYTIILQ